MVPALNTLPAGVAGRAHRATHLLHSLVYFVPEAEQEYVAAGLPPDRMGYFASRSAAMGAVDAGAASASFFSFNPDLVAQNLPRAWSLAGPEQILAARLRVADRALRRLLGEASSTPELDELAELARAATQPLRYEARPMFAAHAGLPWPSEAHLILWHAATLLREYRGDGHAAVLLGTGLSGLEALMTDIATGRGFSESAAKQEHGWSDQQWTAAADRLRERGYLDPDQPGRTVLSAAGVALRESIERDTDALDSAAWLHLGAERTGRLVELGKRFTRTVIANGAFPPELLSR